MTGNALFSSIATKFYFPLIDSEEIKSPQLNHFRSILNNVGFTISTIKNYYSRLIKKKKN